ncbi:hypothetical protein K469DRAFT_703991 [Zopfia rhizophila CBS 207.26]|uniref:Uncharacterized protein n=1 Tax=Zopfia rhizophila CBS 207.26 TaxID=1314779 RepID=A0A6A6D689_9PEZI|nr:hypothetical protein K469DRAFT_703991 [Zopfia rhizophila CBS 207.26]
MDTVQDKPCFFFRDPERSSDSSSPWAGLSLPLGLHSDMLHEALKKAYPQYGDIKQRLRKALADFLILELENSRYNGIIKPESPRNAGNRHPDSPRPYTDNSTVSDSENPDPQLSSPSSGSVLSPDHSTTIVNRNRPDASSDMVPSPPQNPSQMGQMFAWDSKSGSNVTPKTRRRMNDDERAGYKNKRVEGACSSCRKNKCRCTHPKDLVTNTPKAETSSQRNKRKQSRDLGQGRTKVPKLSKTEETPDGHPRSPADIRGDPRRTTTESTSMEFPPHHITSNNFYQRQNDGDWGSLGLELGGQSDQNGLSPPSSSPNDNSCTSSTPPSPTDTSSPTSIDTASPTSVETAQA